MKACNSIDAHISMAAEFLKAASQHVDFPETCLPLLHSVFVLNLLSFNLLN